MTSPTTSHENAARPRIAAPLMVVAAGGALPVQVAEAAVASGRPVFIVGIEGEADDRIRAFPHAIIKWGHIGRLEKYAADANARDVVLVGSIGRRPDFRNIGFDTSTLRILPRILKTLAGGDDTVLGGVIRILEGWGLRVVGPHEIATELVAPQGAVAGPPPSATDLADATCAIEAAIAIGRLDIGQAAVAIGRRVVALEAAEGTDAIVRRVGDLRATGRFKWSGRSGVLAKCAKPGQDLRVDMPTIGPRTVELVAEVGLAGIVVEAGRVMIAERPATVAAAIRTNTFIRAQDVAVPDRGP
jgi:hypothetical protein